MANVITTKSGTKRETTFKVTSCAACNGELNSLKDGWRVRTITFVNAKRTSRFRWFHRRCVK